MASKMLNHRRSLRRQDVIREGSFGTRSAAYPPAHHPELALAICVEGGQNKEIIGRGSNPGAGG
jgi:hypothetical protein